MATPADMLGRFVWHELVTTNLEATLQFYQSLFPEWSIARHSQDDGSSYCEIRVGQFDCGGIVALPAESNVSQHWVGYVATDDCSVVVRRAESLGGACVVSPVEIPHVGKFCLIRDSSGATFKPFEVAESYPLPAFPESGQFAWDELMTKDLSEARRFYETTFGWSSIETIMPQTGPYVLFKVGDRDVAGALALSPNSSTASYWLPYLAASDIDARTVRAEQLGARICLPPADIPNVGRFAVLSDPFGAAFALILYSPHA